MIVAIIAGHYFLHFRWEAMKFLPKEENNLCLRYTALRIWRLIGDAQAGSSGLYGSTSDSRRDFLFRITVSAALIAIAVIHVENLQD
jgi:hypothetical protein